LVIISSSPDDEEHESPQRTQRLFSELRASAVKGLLLSKGGKTMKTIGSGVLILVLSGLALASQSGEQKEHPARPMMQEMMKGKEGEHMDGMMRMMKMMDQCSAMMESSHRSEETKQNPKK
jgi:hypothetical protein